jgi:hypothetical protein
MDMEFHVTVACVTTPKGGTRVRVKGAAGQRTYAPQIDRRVTGAYAAAFEDAVRRYVKDVTGRAAETVREEGDTRNGRIFVVTTA